MEEQPIYILKQSRRRAFLPTFISITALSIIFYLGLLLNISLLELDGNLESITKTASLIILILIVIIGNFLSYKKSKKPYLFFHDRITFNKKSIKYLQIIHIVPHQDFIDKLFKTYSISLGDKFFLRHIPQEINLHNYIQQLTEYAKRS